MNHDMNNVVCNWNVSLFQMFPKFECPALGSPLYLQKSIIGWRVERVEFGHFDKSLNFGKKHLSRISSTSTFLS